MVDRETGEPLTGDVLRDLIAGKGPADPEPELRPQTLLGGARLE